MSNKKVTPTPEQEAEAKAAAEKEAEAKAAALSEKLDKPEDGNKLKSEKELKEMAKEFFKNDPKAEKFHACQDGHFYPAHLEGLAQAHNQELVKGEVYTISKADIK